MNQGMAHLDNIWGCGGGNRPVVSLTNKARFAQFVYASANIDWPEP